MITELTQLPGVLAGEVTGVDDSGRPLVRWNHIGAVAAQCVWMPGAPQWRDCIGARVVVGFLNGDEAQPIVLGLLERPSVLVNAAPRDTTEPETLRIEAGQELVIECGEAKISLRQDGRIEIRGTHLISRSSGPNKIKGGSVFIN